MGSLAEWYQRIPTPDDLTRVESLFANIQAQFPQLKLEFKWNQPMFTDPVSYTHLTLPTIYSV